MVIAVLSSNYLDTLRWLETRFDMLSYNRQTHTFTDRLSNNYVIVSADDHVLSGEFCCYIKAPNYETLEDRVRTRVR